MAPDTTLALGNFTFSRVEIPERIRFGGAQHLAIHELIGGTRIVDSMGRSDRALEWSGLFLSSDADIRARYIDGLRVSGNELILSWGQHRYLVIVREFEADYERFYQVPYRIVCEVIEDQTAPTSNAPSPAIDDAITADLTSAQVLIAGLGTGPLTPLIAALNTAVAAVVSFQGAAQSVLNSVLAPLGALQVAVSAAIAPLDVAIGAAGALGGLIVGAPLVQNVAALVVQTANIETLNTLYQVQGVLGRMQGNLICANASSRTIAVAGGTLFALAEQQYDDATAWTAIAKANGLTDPFIQGTQVLTIPPQSDNSGGVLSS